MGALRTDLSSALAIASFLVGCGDSTGAPATMGNESDAAVLDAAAPDAAVPDASTLADSPPAFDAPAPFDAAEGSTTHDAESEGMATGDAGTITLYAAADGAGTACSLPAPCALGQAIAAVRVLAPTMNADINVYLRGGTYRLSSPISLGVADSGQNGHRIVYRAYPSELPSLSGAVAVIGFTQYDSASNIWRAPIPAAAMGAPSRQLFVNGVRAQRARTAGSPSGVTATSTGFTTTDGSYTKITNASRVEVARDNDWKHLRCPLAAVTATATGGAELTVSPSCWSSNHLNVPSLNFPWNGYLNPPLSLDGISWVENAYELLTSPGQFYVDIGGGFIYYMPRSGEDLGTADVELPVAEALLTLRGTPGHLEPLNDTDAAVTYSGSGWQYYANRAFGDFQNDAHATTVNGDSVTVSFTGSGIAVLGELDPSHGPFQVYLDGMLDPKAYTEAGSARMAQSLVYAVSNLPVGPHTVKLVNTGTGGAYTLLDAFVPTPTEVAPVHDLAFEGIAFEYATWNLPSSVGYINNQAGVLWDTTGATPTAFRIPAAVQVHRGANVAFAADIFAHLGETAIDLADGTQNSSIVGCAVTDTSGGGISVGEVDDYFQTDAALMTLGDRIADNSISFVGREYHDAVGIWAGYTRQVVVDHNDIGHTSYSGLSLGWGWGWASSCALQSAQGNLPTCRHGNIYAGQNSITANYVHDVMGYLADGAPIYTNGGQGDAIGSVVSELAGNFVTRANQTSFGIYQDEGSSYWSTHDNVSAYGANDSIGFWTPTIYDITVGPNNWTDTPNYWNNGTSITFTPPTVVDGGAWPAAAAAIMASAGLEPAYRAAATTVDDDDQSLTYTGTWSAQGFRGYGDFEDNVHYTTTDGDSVALVFAGTSATFIGERDPSQGHVQWYIDGTLGGTIDTSLPSGTARQAQQPLVSTGTLASGKHTLKIVKLGGSYMTVDAFRIAP